MLHAPLPNAAQERRVSSSLNPMDFKAGMMAPRLGNNAPLINIH
jgi:hypothetical protein